MNELARIHKILAEGIHSKILLKVPFVKPIETAGFINRILSLLKSADYKANCPNFPFCIILKDQNFNSTLDLLDFQNLQNYLENNVLTTSNIISLNYFGLQLESDYSELIETGEEASNFTSNHDILLFFISGCGLQVFYKGKIIAEPPQDRRIGQLTGKELPISEYKKLLEKFHDTKVKKEQGFWYWENKNDFILMKKPEKHFRKHLANFLKENTSDAVTEEYAVNGTDDKVDIAVFTRDFQLYFFEVKWLGKSEKGGYEGSSAISCINSGLLQLNTYLKTEKKTECGALVVFDGRKEQEEIQILSEIKVSLSKKLVKAPIFLSLNPNSASHQSKKEVANILKVNKSKTK